MKIMQSFADCSSCDLMDENSIIMDTNSKADLSKVDVVFVDSSPSASDIKQEKPLTDKY